MKMVRPALAGLLPAIVLLVCVQFNAHAASAPPWLTGDDAVNHHIWHRAGMLSNGATSATARVSDGFSLRQLLFEDRVAYQRAIEEVYWRHRIWPKERPDRKPSLDTVMSQATIEQKVQDYLRNSELLEQEWQKPIMPEQLQAEMDRMAQHTKQPEVLRELFAALGNDPFVIAECLARPVLLERLQFASAEWREEPLESWNARAQDQMPNVMAAANADYALPAIPDQPSDCIDDSWTATSTTNAPTARTSHTAVWTGSEMIVWGGYDGSANVNTGGRYNPSTDSWTATSTTNAPTVRNAHTAVWTGSEMIVWGGSQAGPLNTGGRYNPGTDSWTATTTTSAPTARFDHTAVWTGSEMIVWGGFGSNTGGRYNPDTDSWTATSATNAPSGRNGHTAVWTGSEMIVWGGCCVELNTGGRYNPSTDSWTATSTINAPTARAFHKAVWTGSEMIVWGGSDENFVTFNTGGRYNPSTDSWTATSTTNAPTGRTSHTAVWSGSEMIVWGGQDEAFIRLNSGGRYNPGTDSWTATTNNNAPTGRSDHTAVWSGSQMIIWGGTDSDGEPLNTGGRYCAQAGGQITVVSAASHKKHGNAGTFDIDLPLTGTPGVECRVGNGGTFRQAIVFTFSEPVTSVSGTTTTTCGRVNSTTINGSTVTVELGHVNCDGSDINVTVSGVNGASGSVDASATMTLRTGDVNADGVVNNTDLKEIRMNVGRGLVTDDDFRDDITVDGKVNHGDTTLEKSKL